MATIVTDFSGYNIKRKGRLWNLVPLTGRNRYSCAFGGTIWLTPKRFDDLFDGNPKGSTLALVNHEIVHIKQAKRERNFKKRYLFNRGDRLKFEAEAYALQAYIRTRFDKRQRGRHYFVSRYAQKLGAKVYLLFKSYGEIYDAIDREYDKLEKR